MREDNLVAKARRRFKITTKANSDAITVSNKLAQDFKADKPNEKFVSDITYIWTAAGWLYLAVVMDLFSRKIVGMAMGERITNVGHLCKPCCIEAIPIISSTIQTVEASIPAVSYRN